MFDEEPFIEVQLLFDSRVEEARRFVEFNKILSSSKANRLARSNVSGNTDGLVSNYEVDRNLKKTLRASAFLILYNLVESTMTNAVDAIHKAMVNDDCDYPLLTDSMQKVVLRNFKNAMSKAGVNDDVFFSDDPVKVSLKSYGYQKTFLFSGNICARTIRDCASKYGFVIPDHDAETSKNGRKIYDIKEKRDHLAHGRVSFEECGQEIASEDIEQLFIETTVYLRAVLQGVSDFIHNKRYLRAGQ